MDCFAEPAIGRGFAPTPWLAMTAALLFREWNVLLVFPRHLTAVTRGAGATVDRPVDLLLSRHLFSGLFLLWSRSLLGRGRRRWRGGCGRRRRCRRLRGWRCGCRLRGGRRRRCC